MLKLYFVLFSEKKNQKPLAVDVLLEIGIRASSIPKRSRDVLWVLGSCSLGFWRLVSFGCSLGSLVGLPLGLRVVPIFFTEKLQCRGGLLGLWLLRLGFRLDKLPLQRAENMAGEDSHDKP